IGRWVLAEACRQAIAWRSLRADGQPPVVSVNLSARQLQDPALADSVQSVLHETRLEPARLRLEVAEPSLSRATPAVTDSVRALACDRAQGYFFAEPLPAEAVSWIVAANSPIIRNVA